MPEPGARVQPIAPPYEVPTQTTVPVGTGSTLVLAANTAAVYRLLMNDSDTVVYMMLGAAAVVGHGIRLNANGGSYEMAGLLGNMYTGAIYAIPATGTKNILAVEAV